MSGDADDRLLRRLAELPPDRRALLEALLDEPASPPRAVSRPLTAAEQTLRAIWEQVLGIADIGPNADFFVIGGDSIAAMRVAAKAQKAGLALTVRDLMTHPTIAAAAAIASSTPRLEAGRAAVDTRPLPLTPGQWPLVAAGSGPRGATAHSMTVTVPSAHRRALPAVLTLIARRHDALRLRLRPAPAGWELIEDPRLAPAPWVDVSGVCDADGTRLLTRLERQLTATIGDPDRPLCRSLSVQTRDDARLMLAGHGCCVDRASLDILQQEIAQVLPACLAGRPASLPDAPRFGAWMLAQTSASRPDGAAAERSHRSHALRDTIARDVILPSGWPPRQHGGSSGEIERWTLMALALAMPAEAAAQVVTLAANARTTPALRHAVGCYVQPTRLELAGHPLLVRIARADASAPPASAGISCRWQTASVPRPAAEAPLWSSHPLEIVNEVDADRWRTIWRFDATVHPPAALRDQCQRFCTELARLAAAPGREPVAISDAFVEAELTPAELDGLLAG